MYDPITSRLIRSSPPLQGLDRDRLPEEMAKVFAEISAARLRIREGLDVETDALRGVINRMRRLALTNEALVASTPNRLDRASAAFVAGSAHVLSFNANSILGDAPNRSYLGAQSISTDLAAILLFLIAEATPDAAELATKIQAEDGQNPIVLSLIGAVQGIAKGELEQLCQQTIPTLDLGNYDSMADAAIQALYLEILKGVIRLAQELLHIQDLQSENAQEIFFRVKGLASAAPDDQEWLTKEIGAFSGPHHLASLLIALSLDLPGITIHGIPPPTGVSPEKWRESIRRIAIGRPYLWRNHREAIDKGYLNPGVSAAVGFPTGAGKSTLSELKINSTLLMGKKVVFLAPTNALVGQVTAALKRVFPSEHVTQENLLDISFNDISTNTPEVVVMTPEACLAQISVNPSGFEDVGMLVFDECHLLHNDANAFGRRALDSMLCILGFASLAPSADFLLLSAMMKNTGEIASWLQSFTGRPCLELSLAWKPTRQLRGSVVYRQVELEELSKGLVISSKVGKTIAPSTKDKEALICQPLGLFGLQQTWATRKKVDYALLPLLSENINLGANKYWKITPNSGEVSSRIANEAAKSGLKTLVFFQTIKNAASAVAKLKKLGGRTSVRLNEKENKLLRISELEMGGADHLYIDIKNGRLNNQCVVHHGLLLTEERHLCESIYARPDGAAVMVATSTVAQGMNFPSELVIIAEDSRFDENLDRRKVLEAQDLLNAAGRAGRAGSKSNGIVLVVPGKVVGVDFNKGIIGSHWNSLQEIFAQSDQCLVIDDPITAILDRVHANTATANEVERYVISRLGNSVAGKDVSEKISKIISRSLGAYRAIKQGDKNWISERINAAIKFYENHNNNDEFDNDELQIASTLGIPVSVVSALSKEVTPELILKLDSVEKWCSWMFAWISRNAGFFKMIIRDDTLEDLFGGVFVKISNDDEKATYALPYLKKLTKLWMAGASLSKLELAMGTDVDNLKVCIKARRFVLRVIPELAYFFGIPLLVHQHKVKDTEILVEFPAALAQFGRCVKEGFDSYEKFALSQLRQNINLSRMQVHDLFGKIAPYLDEPAKSESWKSAFNRVRGARDSYEDDDM